MTVEISLDGVECNLSCDYCYQNNMRRTGNTGDRNVDFETVFSKVKDMGNQATLFGGEALLLPKKELERILAWGNQELDSIGLQTNGTLIDDEHIEMFAKYDVDIGISIDGPGKLNDLRSAENKKITRRMTKNSMEAIDKLADHPDLSFGLIVCLHDVNAGNKEKLSKLKDYLWDLFERDRVNANFHMMGDGTGEMDDQYKLTPAQEEEAFLDLARFHESHPVCWKPFSTFKDMLRGKDGDATCIWNKCDPFTTRAVKRVHGDGYTSNCDQVDIEGVNWKSNDDRGYERYLSLHQTPQEKGGCKGCRFWSLCGGQGPCHGDDSDWRNKTEHCGTIKSLLSFYEKQLSVQGETPITEQDDLLESIEKQMLSELKNGKNRKVEYILRDRK